MSRAWAKPMCWRSIINRPLLNLRPRLQTLSVTPYLVDKLSSKYDATAGRAIGFRTALRTAARLSERGSCSSKVRAAHGLVSVGDQLVTDQQLGELNTALLTAGIRYR